MGVNRNHGKTKNAASDPGDRIYVATAVQARGSSELKVGLYGDIGAVKESESNQWRLLALDKSTGEVIWNVLGREAVPKVPRHTKATHCNSTPATDGNFSVVAANTFEETCLATPAISGGTLFFRLRDKLVAVGPKR